MQNLSSKLALVAVFLLILITHSATAHAATASSSGITISPGQLLFNLATQTSSQALPITITNNYGSTVTLSATFNGIDENANLLIPATTLDPSFAAALSLSQTEVTIPAHSAKMVTVQATDLSSLAPGGHYATLVLTQQDQGGSPLSVKAAVSVTIFVVKNPGAYQSIALSGISTNHWLFRLPTNASLGFTNTGNVLVVPRATILVFSHGGHTLLEKGVANVASFPLLPGKQAQTTATFSSVGTTWLPQKVEFEVLYRPDGASQLNTATGSFWYIPPIYLLIFVPVGFSIWRAIDRRRRRGHPLPDSITRVPPLGIMRRLQSATRQIFITERDEATPIKVIVASPPKKLESAEEIALKKPAGKPKSPRKTIATKRNKPKK